VVKENSNIFFIIVVGGLLIGLFLVFITKYSQENVATKELKIKIFKNYYTYFVLATFAIVMLGMTEQYGMKVIPVILIMFICCVLLLKINKQMIVCNATPRVIADAFEMYLKKNNISYIIKLTEPENNKHINKKKFIINDVEILVKYINQNVSLYLDVLTIVNNTAYRKTGIKITPFYKKTKVFKWRYEIAKIANELMEKEEYKVDKIMIKSFYGIKIDEYKY